MDHLSLSGGFEHSSQLHSHKFILQHRDSSGKLRHGRLFVIRTLLWNSLVHHYIRNRLKPKRAPLKNKIGKRSNLVRFALHLVKHPQCIIDGADRRIRRRYGWLWRRVNYQTYSYKIRTSPFSSYVD